MSILRKLFAGISVLAMIAMVAPAGAITVEELNAQIAALTAQIAALQGTTTTGTTAITGVPAGFTFQTNLKLGSTNSDVVYLKKVLDAEVPTHAAWTGSSYFGVNTKAAVIAFQEKYAADCLASFGLTAGTGFVGSATRAKLNTILASGSTGTGTGTGTGTVVTGTGLTVTLASDTPAAGTFIRDTGVLVAQANASFTKFVFTNGDSAEAVVTTLKLKRGGISSDTDIAGVYLYDGATQLAEYSAFSSQIVTFTNASGLFTVPAGGSKTITVKGDLANSAATVASINFGINASTDVLSNATAVNGTFPLTGNNMAVATVADLGYVNITNTGTFPGTIDPGVTGYELWRMSVQASDQDMQIEKIMITLVGTISATDVQNLKLTVGGVAITDVIQLASDKTLTFDFSANPYKITKGQTKIITVTGDVPTGTGRAFKFTIRKVSDFIVKDTMYGIYVKPLVNGAAFAVIDADAGNDGTNIQNGTLTISVATDSPSGNVANSSTNVSLAKWNFKANGEAIKITQVGVTVTSSANEDIENGKLYYNGSQVGATDDDVDSGVVNPFTTTIIIPAGETGVFEYKADMTDAGGTALTPGSTITAVHTTASLTAVGQSSLAAVTGSNANGRTLTVATGAMSIAKNNSMADYTSALPTGVKGAANVKVGSFVMTAGAGEGVTITQIVVSDDSANATSNFGDNFQNLKLMHGTTQVGTTQGTLSVAASADYTFNVSPSITLAAGQQYVVDVYADILSAAAGFDTAATLEVGLEVEGVTATGVVTGGSATLTGQNKDLQKLYIATTGTLTVASVASPTTPVAGQLVNGSTGNTFFVASFAAGAAEAVQVSEIIITDTTSFGGSLNNIELWSAGTGAATPVQLGSAVAALSDADTATFNLATPWVIPANTTYYLVVKAGVNTYDNAVSGGTHTLNIVATTGVTAAGVSSGTAIAESGSATAAAQDVYRTKLTAAKNASSPSGSSVAGAASEVLRFDVAANSNYTGALSVAAITMSGSANMTGDGDATLYDNAAPSTALKTEGYQTITFADNAGGDVGNEYTFQDVGAPTSCDGIPVGATVRIYDNDAPGYLTGTFVVSAVDSNTNCTITFATPPTTDLDDGDILYYRPMQPGSGRVYFGAQTVLGADVLETATTLTVSSISGFSTGDTVTVLGYEVTTGTAMAGASTIKTLSGTTITLDGAIGDMNGDSDTSDTLDFNYTSATAANAIAKKHNSVGVVYEGTGANGSINKQVTAGTTVTFIVKGDTTGATTNNTLRADIAAAGDFTWSDSLSWTITTDTVTFPVTGGTLTY